MSTEARGRRHRLRRLFALMLLRVPVGMAMGLVGISGFGYLVGSAPGAEAGRPDLDAHGDGLHFRRDPDVPADGRVRVAFGHEPRIVSRRQHAFVGHWRGGLGIATIARLRRALRRSQGSSVATAATFAAVAYPEMRRYRLSAILCRRRDRRPAARSARCCRPPRCSPSTALSPSRISASCSSPASCPDCWRSPCT